MRLLYDDFADHCAPHLLENSLQLVLDRLEERAKRKSFVELLPLPTGPRDLHRLKPLFRHNVFTKYYPDSPDVRGYLKNSGIREKLLANPRHLDEELARIARELETRPPFVYGSRDKTATWEGNPLSPGSEPIPDGADPGEITREVPAPASTLPPR